MVPIKVRNIFIKLAGKEDSDTKRRNNWKFPKIPVHELYYKKLFTIFSSYSIKDFERTISITSFDKLRCFDLLSYDFDFRKGFIKKKHKFLHLGLVQVAIKPLVRDGLKAPILVFIKDARHRDLNNTLLAVVEHNLAQGPFYFNCFPSFSVSLDDRSYDQALRLAIKTSGVPTGVSLALTVRVVCKAMVDLRAESLEEEPMFGMTKYFNTISGADTTIFWDQVFDFSPNMGATSNNQ